jgi:transcription elongation factor Elf1
MTLQLETDVSCPHCGETFTLLVDTSAGDHATIEDCAVCCQPIGLDVRCEPGEIFSIAASAQ